MSKRGASSEPPVAVLLVALLLGLLAWAGTGFAGCSSNESDRVCPQPTACPQCACAPAAVVDPTLLAFLSKARASHHEADLAEQAGQRDRAIAVLERLVGGPVPGGAAPSPEVREVLADTYARLAELRSTPEPDDAAMAELEPEQFDAAMDDIDRGLQLATEPTHFRGRLLEIRGLVEERRAKTLELQGHTEQARQARERAIAAFEKAIATQDQVIRQALADAGTTR